MRLSDLPKPGTPRFKLRALKHRVNELYPDTPEGALWLAVFLQAAEDATGYVQGRLNSFYAADAREYLRTDRIPACELCGVDSSYARRVLLELGILR